MLFSGPADQRELRAAGRFNIVETRAVRFAHFTRDIQPKPAPADGSGEKRFEELGAQRRRHAGTIVHHVQFYNTAFAFQVHRNAYARFLALAVAQRVAAEVPHHLVEMTAVEQHARIGFEFDREDLGADLFDLAELLDKSLHEVRHPEALALRPV